MRIRPNRRILGALPVLLAAVFFGLTFTMFPGTGSEEPLSTAVIRRRSQALRGLSRRRTCRIQCRNRCVRSNRSASESLNITFRSSSMRTARSCTANRASLGQTRAINRCRSYIFICTRMLSAVRHSTFNLESGGKLREDKMTADSIGHMDILSIRHDSGADLLHTMRYLQPDDGNEADQTLMNIKLPEAVDPGNPSQSTWILR